MQVDIMEQIMTKSPKEEIELRVKPQVKDTLPAISAPARKEMDVVTKKNPIIAVKQASQSDDSDEFKDVQQPESTDKEVESLIDLIPLLRPSL